ncbi:MAG TPA: efflux RND transporter permease subunit, partial [bacterium]|nr:efflux RND transporter permease subunit [bacterium]
LLGYEITMMSMFGMVALAGIVVNDAIVFIDCFNERLRQGLPFIEALREGGMRRLQPILLTTSTTVAGLAPLIMEKSFQAQFLIPMAVSIASGLIFATLLTLFFIPCLLVALNDLRRLWRLLWTGSMPTREAVEPAITLRVEDHEPFVESKVRDYGV